LIAFSHFTPLSISKIKFKLIELSEAETLFKIYNMETENIINQIK